MSKTYEFLNDCGIFFVSTIDGDHPAVRPFGAVMEYENELYISTGSSKDVYRQMKKNPAIQIIALPTGSRTWLRVNGNAVEVTDIAIKEHMMKMCPAVARHHDSPNDPEFAVFCIKDAKSLLCDDSEKKEIDC